MPSFLQSPRSSLLMDENKKITINEIGVSASELLAEIHRKSFQNSVEKSWTSKEFVDLFSTNGTKCYLINDLSEPIGFSLIRSVVDEAEIITFCVLPNWCKNGYATLLLEWVIKELQDGSFKRLFLEVRENNKEALGLYKKCSFDIVGRRKGYYNNHQGVNFDALVMQRDLVEQEQ